MKRARRFILGVLFLASARPCLAASAGAEPFDFLFLDANARAVGMGGAYTALAGDANALLYNPAGLAKAGRNELTFMHNEYFASIKQEYAAYAGPAGLGAELNYLSFGSVQRTTIDNPGGSGLGETTLTDMALEAGYGREVARSLALGAGIKYIREMIAGERVTGYAVDIGALYSPPALERLSLGLALQNLGPMARSPNSKENLPLNLRAGAAYALKLLGQDNLIAFDVTKERTDSVLFATGFETRLMDRVALRFGFNTRNRLGVGVSGGFGYIFSGGSVDYAFVPMGDAGDAHRISLTLRWGEGRTVPLAPVARTLPSPVPAQPAPVPPKPAPAPAPPPAPAAQAPEPASRARVLPANLYWVRVGSFMDGARAEEFAADLSAAGHSVSVVVDQVNGVLYHRVRVGPFMSRPEAQAEADKLAGAVIKE